MNEEQLQLFDPTDYLGMDGMWNIELEMTDEEEATLHEAASIMNMSVNDYIIHALHKTVGNLTCTTCGEYRSTGDVCSQCGELDQ